jgi:hypothetical protein
MSKIFRPTESSKPQGARVNGQSTERTWPETDLGLRELAHRSSAGLDVALLWHPARDELTVRGSDHLTGARFTVRPERHLALDVYYHPYRYVTCEDIGYEDERLPD